MVKDNKSQKLTLVLEKKLLRLNMDIYHCYHSYAQLNKTNISVI